MKLATKNKIFIEGQEYRLMRIGVIVDPLKDIRFESSWYTKDPEKQAECGK